jgi:hypothetical protein
MAFEKVGLTHTFQASTGLKQYQFVNITGANNRLINPTTEGNCIGVLISSGTTGSTGLAGSTDSGSVQTVQLDGIAKLVAGTTTIDAGEWVKAAVDGRAEYSTGATSTSHLAGRSLEAVTSTSTSAQVISVILASPVTGV